MLREKSRAHHPNLLLEVNTVCGGTSPECAGKLVKAGATLL
jgi:hypothetical protein